MAKNTVVQHRALALQIKIVCPNASDIGRSRMNVCCSYQSKNHFDI